MKLKKMVINKNSFFNFDYLMLIDGNTKFSNNKFEFLNKDKSQKILGATLNHRLFKLNQKSAIKSEVDFLNINHLMFSIRPSLQEFFSKKYKKKLAFYKDFLQLYFCIIISIKYKINSIILDEDIKNRLKIPKDMSNFIKTNLKLILNKTKKNEKKFTIFKIINLDNIDLNDIKIIFLKIKI